MAANVNTALRDRALAHLIDLHRFANGEVRAMLATLRAADVEMFDRLRSALDRLDPESFTVRRLETQLAAVWAANDAAYRQMAITNAADMRDLTDIELNAQENMFKDLLPSAAQTDLTRPTLDSVWATTKARPLMGRLMGEWFSSLAASRQQRISDTLRMGYVTGATTDEMVRSLRGTRAANYTDGILSIDARHAEAVVRTATAGTAAQAREAFYGANSSIIDKEQWVSTLDSRTTEMCQIRDGLLYTADTHEPIHHDVPWDEGPGELHWNCRSTSIPIIASAKSLGLDLPPPERAAMNGVAPPGTTFADWIASQPASVQDSALGATKGKMLRSGTSFDRFFTSDGTPLSVDDLRGRV